MNQEEERKTFISLYALVRRVEFLERKLISVCAGCRDCGTAFAQSIANDLDALMEDIRKEFPDSK